MHSKSKHITHCNLSYHLNHELNNQNNYVMRFVPFTVLYDTEFEGWPTEGATAALSHPSEGWHEKGHMDG
jgi:hypothetical protein